MNESPTQGIANLSVITTPKTENEIACEIHQMLIGKCKELLPIMNEASYRGYRVEIGFQIDGFGRNVIGRCALVKEVAA